MSSTVRFNWPDHKFNQKACNSFDLLDCAAARFVCRYERARDERRAANVPSGRFPLQPSLFAQETTTTPRAEEDRRHIQNPPR